MKRTSQGQGLGNLRMEILQAQEEGAARMWTLPGPGHTEKRDEDKARTESRTWQEQVEIPQEQGSTLQEPARGHGSEEIFSRTCQNEDTA